MKKVCSKCKSTEIEITYPNRYGKDIIINCKTCGHEEKIPTDYRGPKAAGLGGPLGIPIDMAIESAHFIKFLIGKKRKK
ncbi:hypothetical protein JW879_03460 [candidate division WOR-3 bacterium]|nr:hypothetical protein [candidate division WOR-3 bacterium]